MHWNEGYVSDIAYTHGYYHELNPLRVKLGFALAGLVAPEVRAAAELGFGQGMSLLLHCAGAGVAWYGNDFNPAQAAFARELGGESGAPAYLSDEAFAEFCNRPDLPEFDFIGLHGIWSWVSEENRDIIVDFLRRKLRVGGVVYLSYNALPGWGGPGTMRHLMNQHDLRLGVPGKGIVSRVEEALAFVDRVFEVDPAFNRRIPAIRERFNALRDQSRNYLAHEFFNQNWKPFYFSEVAEALSPAKLEFACSANFVDAVNPLNLSDEHMKLLDDITDPLLKETVRDFMVNQYFRKDYWVKGARKYDDHNHGAAVRAVELVLIVPREDVPMKVRGARGEADLAPENYDPILNVLADHRPHSIGSLEREIPDLRLGTMIQAIMVLASLGVVTVATTPTDDSRASAQRLNGAICRRAIGSGDIAHLSSPVSGSGIQATRFQMLFLMALAEGHRTPAEWADYAWGVLVSQNQRMTKEGKSLQTVEENVALMNELAETFARTGIPMLQALEAI